MVIKRGEADGDILDVKKDEEAELWFAKLEDTLDAIHGEYGDVYPEKEGEMESLPSYIYIEVNGIMQ